MSIGSVHRESMSVIVQQAATIYNLLYFCKLLYKFRVVHPPIIKSTYNCVPSAVLEEMERSSNSSTIAEGSRNDLTCARCCNYSLCVLLIMGEGITFQSLLSVISEPSAHATFCEECRLKLVKCILWLCFSYGYIMKSLPSWILGEGRRHVMLNLVSRKVLEWQYCV